MTKVRIPPTLRAETGGSREVEVAGDTVREVLDDLAGLFPGLRSQIYQDGDLAPFLNVYVGGEDVRTLDGLDTAVEVGGTVILLPAMAGGSLAPLAGIAYRRAKPGSADARRPRNARDSV